MVDVINYGMGNVGSIVNMLKKVGVQTNVITTPEQVAQSESLIIPGVGRFDNAMRKLAELNLIDELNSAAMERKIPVLGICLGMQLMTRRSDEGKINGLGWVEADVIKFDTDNKSIKVPHMGWNIVNIKKKSSLFDSGDDKEQRFYFVHSYAVYCDNGCDILTTTEYANEFVSGFECNNIVGVQFHPEKSHKFGEDFLRNFSLLTSE